MEKQDIYPLVGLVWMACCIYQIKNNNMFMIVVSAVISAMFFLLAAYRIYKKYCK